MSAFFGILLVTQDGADDTKFAFQSGGRRFEG
jgi:hypothetical protein